MSGHSIELKGSVFTLTVLHLENDDPAQIHQQLQQKASQAPRFFDSAPLVINVEHLSEVPDFDDLIDAIASANFIPVGVSGITSDSMRIAAKHAGLAILTTRKENPENAVTLHTPKENLYKDSLDTPLKNISDSHDADDQVPTKIIQGNVRSGQQIYSPGPIVIIGSVSNGAEIISNDSIHVYGTLRGRALAGARGNFESRIFCRHLEAELVSIAGHYLLSDNLPEQCFGQEIQIRLENEKIIFDKLMS